MNEREMIAASIDALMESDRDCDWPLIEAMQAYLAAPVALAGDIASPVEPVAWLHTVRVLNGEPSETYEALSFAADSFLLGDAGLFESVSAAPLYTHAAPVAPALAPPDVQRDADRYRWLADTVCVQSADSAGPTFRMDVRRGNSTLWSLGLAIDKAMSATKGVACHCRPVPQRLARCDVVAVAAHGLCTENALDRLNGSDMICVSTPGRRDTTNLPSTPPRRQTAQAAKLTRLRVKPCQV